jgi:hypothetical protein
MVEVAESYEIVGNFNNFKAFVMFAVKKLEAFLILVEKCSIYLINMLKNFFDPPPPRQHFREKFVLYLVKILGNVGQNMTTPPPPPMLMTSRRPCRSVTKHSTRKDHNAGGGGEAKRKAELL